MGAAAALCLCRVFFFFALAVAEAPPPPPPPPPAAANATLPVPSVMRTATSRLLQYSHNVGRCGSKIMLHSRIFALKNYNDKKKSIKNNENVSILFECKKVIFFRIFYLILRMLLALLQRRLKCRAVSTAALAMQRRLSLFAMSIWSYFAALHTTCAAVHRKNLIYQQLPIESR